MSRKNIPYMLCCLAAVAGMAVSCKQKHTYDFTYSPDSPKAGEKVIFVNTSDAGESWLWKFGDGGKSSLKSPTHVYTTAGTYVIEMLADSNKSRIASHVIEILDSIPTIYVQSDTVQQYKPLTIRASYYNPTKTAAVFDWKMDEAFVLTQGELTSDSITGYYTDFGRTADIVLTITINGKTTVASRSLTLEDHFAPSLLMESEDGTQWRQRIYEGIYEDARSFRGDEKIIEEANDSTAVLNGVTYDIHNMPVLTDKEVHALQVDPLNRKLYLILDDGVYVANANGDALTRIVEADALTLLVNTERNSLYWSESDGVKAIPLVTNPQNTISEQLRGKIHQVNDIEDVTRMMIIDD